MAKRVLDIKGKKFWQIAESELKSDGKVKLDIEEDVYVGELSKMKAENINIKSKVFKNTMETVIEATGGTIEIDSETQKHMGRMMAENMILSSKVMTMGGLGSLVGGNIQIDSKYMNMIGGAAIAGRNVGIKAYEVGMIGGTAIAGDTIHVSTHALGVGAAQPLWVVVQR